MSFRPDFGHQRKASCNPVLLATRFLEGQNARRSANFSEFMTTTGCKNELLARKFFETLDVAGTGEIALDECIAGLQKLRSADDDERIRFLFNVFDLDGDGAVTRDELKALLTASLEESGSEMSEEMIMHHVETLLDLFETDASSNIHYRAFRAVLRTYPGLLRGLTFGRFGMEEAVLAGPTATKRFRWIRKAVSWVINNPQRAFTYAFLFLLHANLFMYLFLKYAGNCDGVDMELKDPVTGYSRQDLLRISEESGQFEMNLEDARYAVFSKAMAEHDSIECRDARKRWLFGWTLPVAKGCAQAMKATFTLILLPVSRNLMTTLRDTVLRHLFPFDEAIEVHKFLGRVGFLLSWVHAICHIVHITRSQDPQRFLAWCCAFPEDCSEDDVSIAKRAEADLIIHEDGDLDRNMPDVFFHGKPQPHLEDSLATPAVITGVVLIVIYTIVALFAFDYPKKLSIFKTRQGDSNSLYRRWTVGLGKFLNDFNNFWYSHHLFSIFYVALLFHPLPNLPDERNEWGWSDSWLWITIPVLIYLTERAVRVKRSTDNTPVIDAELLGGDVVRLRLRRPQGFNYTPGQYVFIRCPQISRFEWHPFTLASCPGDPYLAVHVRRMGDWTAALHDFVEERSGKNTGYASEGSISLSVRHSSQTMATFDFPEHLDLSISVDGPFGAPTQDYADFEVIVLIGVGIGITPFVSVIKDLMDSLKRCACHRCGYCNPRVMSTRIKKVYLYWTVRFRAEASWFEQILEEILQQDEDLLLSVQINVSSIERANDVSTMLLSLAQYESGGPSRSDPISRMVTRFGSVKWDEVFEQVKTDFPCEPTVGVFYCGPNTTANIISKMCRISSKGTTDFVFMKEPFWMIGDDFASA